MKMKMAILWVAAASMVLLAACSGSGSGSSVSSDTESGNSVSTVTESDSIVSSLIGFGNSVSAGTESGSSDGAGTESGNSVSSDTEAESSVSAGIESGSSDGAVSDEKTVIDLDDYVVVTFDGYNGIGVATAEIDYDAIESDYGNKIKVNASKENELPNAGYNALHYVKEYTDVTIFPDGELSNDDHVKLTWDVDEAFFDEFFDCTFLYSDRTIEVSGLEIGDNVDVFEGVNVLFSDVAPVGRAEISVNNDHDSRRYTLDKDSGLSNGDVVTVTFNINEDDIEKFVDEYGGMPETDSKEYTVYGLDSYIIDTSQLSEDNLNELKEDSLEKAKEMITTRDDNSVAANSGITNWEGHNVVTIGDDYVLENIYFLSPKEPGQSRIIFVYSVSVTIEFGERSNRAPETTRTYYPVEYYELIQEEDGTLVGMSKGRCNQYNAAGNIDSLYKDYVSDTKDNYVATIYDADLNVVK